MKIISLSCLVLLTGCSAHSAPHGQYQHRLLRLQHPKWYILDAIRWSVLIHQIANSSHCITINDIPAPKKNQPALTVTLRCRHG